VPLCLCGILLISILRETHETPETVAWRLARAGGCNRYSEANYRAVWGWNRLAWIGGKFEERDSVTGSAKSSSCARNPNTRQ
jgi:hypothetical protein